MRRIFDLGMFEFFTSRVWYTSPKYSLVVHTCWRTQEKCRLLHDLESWIKEKKDEIRSYIATSLSTLLMWLFFSKIHLLMCLQWLDRLWQSSYTCSTGYAVTYKIEVETALDVWCLSQACGLCSLTPTYLRFFEKKKVTKITVVRS